MSTPSLRDVLMFKTSAQAELVQWIILVRTGNDDEESPVLRGPPPIEEHVVLHRSERGHFGMLADKSTPRLYAVRIDKLATLGSTRAALDAALMLWLACKVLFMRRNST